MRGPLAGGERAFAGQDSFGGIPWGAQAISVKTNEVATADRTRFVTSCR